MSFQFPSVKDKLDAPTKKSAFERAKAEAEAKKQREAAETAAVYEDFVKSFEDDVSGRYRGAGDRGGPSGRGGAFSGGGRPPASVGKRHFTGPATPARPGGPGSGFPPRKRDLDTYRDSRPSVGRSTSGVLGFDDVSDYTVPKPPPKKISTFVGEEDEDEDADRAVKEQPKPTIQLLHLPPKTNKAYLLDLLKPYFPNLTPNQITVQPYHAPSGPSSSHSQQRKSSSAVITLHSDTAASEIDAAVNGLANRYLGFGYSLAISRHLSSTALLTSVPVANTVGPAPFNARQQFQGPGGRGGHRGGFAPPSSYTSSGGFSQGNRFTVTVSTPKDLKTLKMINKLIEAVLTHGSEFEALLMATRSVQYDERFSWLWDCRSPEHVYYRWKLWDVVTSDGSKKNKLRSRSYSGAEITQIFENGATWEIPNKRTQKFEFITKLDDFIDDEEYHSSSDEEDDSHQMQDSNPSAEETKTYLGPLRRAKLMHLLSRIPQTLGTLRRGDVARITAFAVENAYAAEEVVEILCANAVRPVALSSANPDPSNGAQDENEDDTTEKSKHDSTPMRLIGLYLISDVLSNSGLGVRNVWRYRQLFDQKLRTGKVFESLAEVGTKEGWGKIRQEKWRRSIGIVMGLWENWNIFPQTSHEALKLAFADPTTLANAQAADKAQKSRWKSTISSDSNVDSEPKFNPYLASSVEQKEAEAAEDMIDEDVDGEAMVEDDELEGSDVDGEPMVDSSDEEQDGDPMAADDEKPVEGKEPDKVDPRPVSPLKRPAIGFGFKLSGTKAADDEEGRVRKRMKAEDMFAMDEDDD